MAFKGAIDAAMLWPDINQLNGLEECFIGEKGVTLSGGQKARLSIARAAYAVALECVDVILLDDPLSAVDPSMAYNLFQNLLSTNGGLCGTLFFFLSLSLTLFLTH